jgi:hypothetical protein
VACGMHANAALTMRSGARKKITRFPPVEYIKIPLYYYEVALLAKILRSCRRKGMDVITHSARPPQSGVHRPWVAAPGGEAVKFTEDFARAASSGVRARGTPLGPTRAECGKK